MNAERMGKNGDVKAVVLHLNGNLTNRCILSPYTHQLNQLKEAGQPHVVVDLSDVAIGGAALLGFLVNGHKLLREAGGDLVLAGVSRHMHRLLHITRLAEHFQIFETVDEARAYLKQCAQCCAA